MNRCVWLTVEKFVEFVRRTNFMTLVHSRTTNSMSGKDNRILLELGNPNIPIFGIRVCNMFSYLKRKNAITLYEFGDYCRE